MDSSYLGGMLTRTAMEQRRTANSTAFAGDETWWRATGEHELFLRVRGGWFRVFTWDTLTLFIRGYARSAGSTGPLDLERVAEDLRGHYLEHGSLAVEGLDGSFTVALLDAQARRVLMYRNLVGAGFTYYHASRDGLLFSGNLADLVDVAGVAPRANEAVLPSFFLYRFVPGRETLFDGFYRLLPGEQLMWDEHGLTCVQRRTFADLQGAPVVGDPVEALEATMTAVLRDCAAHRPRTANLLSGGVDSSYLQAIWNRVTSGGNNLPASYSISVDHPRSWIDTDYAMTAAQRWELPTTLSRRRPALFDVSARHAGRDRRAAQSCANGVFRRTGAGHGGAGDDERPVRRRRGQSLRLGDGRRRVRRALDQTVRSRSCPAACGCDRRRRSRPLMAGASAAAGGSFGG